MKRRKQKSRVTHYALRQSGGTDNSPMTPGSSIGPSCKHLFNCEDVNHNDFVSSEQITGFDTNTVAGAAANSVRMSSWYVDGDNGALTTGWDDPAGKDFCLMVCAQAVDGGSGPGPISFYMGDGNKAHVRIQSYLAGTGILNTPVYEYSTPLIAGENYIFAAVYRNGVLEHYAKNIYGDIVYTGSLAVDLSSFDPDNGFNCSHGKLIYDDLVAPKVAQDYFGFLVHHFSDGAPSQSEIIEAMEYHLAQWPVDNKAVYPGWVTVG